MILNPTERDAPHESVDPTELLIKEAREKTRRRRLRWTSLFTLLAAACLIAVGVVHYTSSPTRTSNGDKNASATAAVTCPNARVKLLGVTGIPGAAVFAGLLVRASVSSSAACTMSGYPIVGAELDSHSTAMANDVRFGYLPGGMTKANAPLPRLSITSRPRVVSFTIQWFTGNGHTCPWVNAIEITLPGSREILTARTMYQGGIGVTRLWGIYCGDLQVRPLVNGSSGKGK
jgi:hypothetical protein